LQSTTQVVSDTTRPWDRGGRAKDIIESSERDAEAIGEHSLRLVRHLEVARMLLRMESDVHRESDRLGEKADEEADDSSKAEFRATSHQPLSLMSRFAKEIADQARSVVITPTEWLAKQGLDRDIDHLEFVLRSLDYARWQILKDFAKLVNIFDDHDDPDSNEPCEAWRKDQAAMDTE